MDWYLAAWRGQLQGWSSPDLGIPKLLTRTQSTVTFPATRRCPHLFRQTRPATHSSLQAVPSTHVCFAEFPLARVWVFVVFLLQMADSVPSPQTPHPQGLCGKLLLQGRTKASQWNRPVCQHLLSKLSAEDVITQSLSTPPRPGPVPGSHPAKTLNTSCTRTLCSAPLMQQRTQSSREQFWFQVYSFRSLHPLRPQQLPAYGIFWQQERGYWSVE